MLWVCGLDFRLKDLGNRQCGEVGGELVRGQPTGLYPNRSSASDLSWNLGHSPSSKLSLLSLSSRVSFKIDLK